MTAQCWMRHSGSSPWSWCHRYAPLLNLHLASLRLNGVQAVMWPSVPAACIMLCRPASSPKFSFPISGLNVAGSVSWQRPHGLHQPQLSGPGPYTAQVPEGSAVAVRHSPAGPHPPATWPKRYDDWLLQPLPQQHLLLQLVLHRSAHAEQCACRHLCLAQVSALSPSCMLHATQAGMVAQPWASQHSPMCHPQLHLMLSCFPASHTRTAHDVALRASLMTCTRRRGPGSSQAGGAGGLLPAA